MSAALCLLVGVAVGGAIGHASITVAQRYPRTALLWAVASVIAGGAIALLAGIMESLT